LATGRRAANASLRRTCKRLWRTQTFGERAPALWRAQAFRGTQAFGERDRKPAPERKPHAYEETYKRVAGDAKLVIDAEGERIAKLLARAGVASRREVERMIVDGRIAVNGSLVLTPATLLTSLKGVTVDGNPVNMPEAARLWPSTSPAA
jgi:hypothetical protein